MYTIDLTNKVALVLGGAVGIGAAIARAFAGAGATLAVSYHGDEAAAAGAVARDVESADRRCLVFEADSRVVASIEAAVDRTVAAYGTLDVLVYNSGITEPTPLFEISEEQWDRTLDINLKGMFFCARRAAAHMRDQRKPGSIVLLSSVHSILAAPNHQHYASSKGGINMLTRSLGQQLAPLGIRVNAIAPGAIFVEKFHGVYDPVEAGKAIPIGRVGRPEEMADIAVFLASERASYITGHVLFADGGMTLPLHLG